LPELPPLRTITALTHLNNLRGGMSSAALFACDDGRRYALKHPGLHRALVAEQVVARLGLRIGAPCMEVAIANVPPELVAADPALARYGGGPSHASGFVDGLYEVRAIAHADHPKNRSRFASLCVLFSWALAADHQFLYELAPPHLVHSHDHGLFFPGQHQWTPVSVAAGHNATLDPQFNALVLTPQELEPPRAELETVTAVEIRDIVTAVPPQWGASGQDLQALTDCLCARRDSLLALLHNG
jgi:hypothetical protein